MKNIKKELEKYERKPGRTSIEQAILWVFEDDPNGEYTANGMVKILDEKCAFRVSEPAVASKKLRRLTREGLLIRRRDESENGREVYYYRVRKPRE